MGAGTVFNSNPFCEDEKGGTLGWCNGLSIFIGLLDVLMAVAVAAVIAYYMKQEKCNAWCGSSHERSNDRHRRPVLDGNGAKRRFRMESIDVISFVNPVVAETSIEMTETGSRSHARTAEGI